MAQSKLTETMKETLQTLLAENMAKEQIAKRLGVSKVTVYAWLAQLEEEIAAAVSAKREQHTADLVKRQFNLFDELAAKAAMLTEEINTLRALQRANPTPQTALAIFRGAQVAKSFLDSLGELLGQLQPPTQANVHLTRIEQLLAVQVTADQIPPGLRTVVLDGGRHAT